MALPKLNDTPKYSLIIPSSGQEVRFRPFLVKEEKVMLMALESKDQKQQLGSIVDTISACVQDPIDTNKLTTFDVEYMFTKIRARSVGETARVSVKCEECEHENEVVINVDTIDLKIPQVESLIRLDDNISIEMGYPSYKNVMNTATKEMTDAEQVFNILSHSLVAVVTENERIDLKNETKDEILKFIDSMDAVQFSKIREYVESMPSLKHDISFVCEKCDHENSPTLEGIQNFF